MDQNISSSRSYKKTAQAVAQNGLRASQKYPGAEDFPDWKKGRGRGPTRAQVERDRELAAEAAAEKARKELRDQPYKTVLRLVWEGLPSPSDALNILTIAEKTAGIEPRPGALLERRFEDAQAALGKIAKCDEAKAYLLVKALTVRDPQCHLADLKKLAGAELQSVSMEGQAMDKLVQLLGAAGTTYKIIVSDTGEAARAETPEGGAPVLSHPFQAEFAKYADGAQRMYSAYTRILASHGKITLETKNAFEALQRAKTAADYERLAPAAISGWEADAAFWETVRGAEGEADPTLSMGTAIEAAKCAEKTLELATEDRQKRALHKSRPAGVRSASDIEAEMVALMMTERDPRKYREGAARLARQATEYEESVGVQYRRLVHPAPKGLGAKIKRAVDEARLKIIGHVVSGKSGLMRARPEQVPEIVTAVMEVAGLEKAEYAPLAFRFSAAHSEAVQARRNAENAFALALAKEHRTVPPILTQKDVDQLTAFEAQYNEATLDGLILLLGGELAQKAFAGADPALKPAILSELIEYQKRLHPESEEKLAAVMAEGRAPRRIPYSRAADDVRSALYKARDSALAVSEGPALSNKLARDFVALTKSAFGIAEYRTERRGKRRSKESKAGAADMMDKFEYVLRVVDAGAVLSQEAGRLNENVAGNVAKMLSPLLANLPVSFSRSDLREKLDAVAQIVNAAGGNVSEYQASFDENGGISDYRFPNAANAALGMILRPEVEREKGKYPIDMVPRQAVTGAANALFYCAFGEAPAVNPLHLTPLTPILSLQQGAAQKRAKAVERAILGQNVTTPADRLRMYSQIARNPLAGAAYFVNLSGEEPVQLRTFLCGCGPTPPVNAFDTYFKYICERSEAGHVITPSRNR